MQARACNIKREFTHRDTHSVGTQVAQPENTAAVRYDDDIDLIVHELFLRGSPVADAGMVVDDALPLTVPLTVFLISLALFFVVSAARTGRLRVWLGAGFVLGLACLTRGNHLAFAPVLIGWILLRAGPPPRTRAVAACAVVLGMALAISDASGQTETTGDFAFHPGASVIFPIDDWFIGGDFRGNIITGDGVSGLGLYATGGMRF